MRETDVVNSIVLGQNDRRRRRSTSSHGSRDQPTFLFLGTIDTHGPWIARKPWIDIYSPGAVSRAVPGVRHRVRSRHHARTRWAARRSRRRADIERLRAIYDTAVSYHDAAARRLRRAAQDVGHLGSDDADRHRGSRRGAVRGRPLRSRRLAARLARSACRCSSTIRRASPAARSSTRAPRAIDLLPTILDAIGAPPPRHGAGRVRSSRSRRASGAAGRGRRTRRCTSTRTRCGSGAGRRASGAPACRWSTTSSTIRGELKDVAAAHPIERRMLTDNLGLFLALRKQWKKTAWGVVTNVTAAAPPRSTRRRAVRLDARAARSARARGSRAPSARADARARAGRRVARRGAARRCRRGAAARRADRRRPSRRSGCKGSTHVHARPSGDSQRADPPTSSRWYEDHGYDFIVLTDHNRVSELGSRTPRRGRREPGAGADRARRHRAHAQPDGLPARRRPVRREVPHPRQRARRDARGPTARSTWAEPQTNERLDMYGLALDEAKRARRHRSSRSTTRSGSGA